MPDLVLVACSQSTDNQTLGSKNHEILFEKRLILEHTFRLAVGNWLLMMLHHASDSRIFLEVRIFLSFLSMWLIAYSHNVLLVIANIFFSLTSTSTTLFDDCFSSRRRLDYSHLLSSVNTLASDLYERAIELFR